MSRPPSGRDKHGTYSGYTWHLAKGTPACGPCRVAKAAYTNVYRSALVRLRGEFPARYTEIYGQLDDTGYSPRSRSGRAYGQLAREHRHRFRQIRAGLALLAGDDR